ncbi:MAG: hypothetical protein EXR68_07120 [Dehalococcoidia bacterium]|nr:hypothetical protein [Dehalococcoidia bacterium]
MPMYSFERIARTPHSEQWRIDGETSVLGRVDLHFTGAKTYGTIAVHTSLPEEQIEDLIADIDARLVSTADEYREDFVVTVWRGEEFGTYSEADAAFEEAAFEDEIDEDDDDR